MSAGIVGVALVYGAGKVVCWSVWWSYPGLVDSWALGCSVLADYTPFELGGTLVAE